MPDRTEPRDAQSVREPHPFEAVPVTPGVSTLVAVRDPDPNAPALAALKRYANGKYFLYATTSRRCEARVLRALEASAELRISFDRAGFTARLESDGLSQDEIRNAVDSLEVIDETYSADRWRR